MTTDNSDRFVWKPGDIEIVKKAPEPKAPEPKKDEKTKNAK